MRTLQYLILSLLAVFLLNTQAYSQTYTIKLSSVGSVYELHEQFQQDLEFPYYYGKNWDGFYDCMSDKLNEGQEITLSLTDLNNFKKRFSQDTTRMMNALEDLRAAYPHSFRVVIKK